MTTALLILSLVLILGLMGLVFFLMRKLDGIEATIKAPEGKDMMVLMNQNVVGMQSRLDNVSEGLNMRLDKAAQVISGVSKDLGQVQEMGRAMTDLQNFLRSPKLRGNIGERVLKDMLATYFPQDLYKMQYKFKDGQMVDALIKTEAGFVPVDAKFPLENFQRVLKAEKDEQKDLHTREFRKDVKKHVDAISKKYILPAEGTVDFAVMYVPSESVYYHLIQHDALEELNTYAMQKKVLITSPNSFFYFLRVALMGLQGKKVEEASKQILETLQALSKDAEKVGDHMSVLGTHLNNAGAALQRVESDYAKLTGKLDQVELLKAPTEEV